MSLLRERVALAVATVLVGASLVIVPSWRGQWLEICHLALIASAITLALLFVTRHLGRRGIAIERASCAAFLAGMPVVYVVAWLESGGGDISQAWLWVEIAGFPVYASLAVLGLVRAPWFIVIGIAAHGITWDAWHFAQHSAYIPTWYAIACLIVDVGLAVYLGTRVAAWRKEPAMELQARTLTHSMSE